MAKADEPAAVLVVLESFGAEIDGSAITFHRGETVEPAHPAVKRWPDRFGPLVVMHRVPAKRTAGPTEVRAD